MKPIGSILLFIFAINATWSQETPAILRFSPNDYNAENQNWDIGQDKDKYIYAANNEGLLEYNGAEWTLYPSPNSTIIRSIEVVDNRIYTGSYMQFGYWERNLTGRLQYHPLSQELQIELIEDENFWNIEQFENCVVFQSYDRIYIYDVKTRKIHSLTDKRNYYRIFKLKDGIYVHKRSGHIYKIEKGAEKLAIKIPKELNIEFVLSIFSGIDGLYFLTRSQGLFKTENKSVVKWDIPANNDLLSIKIFSGIRLRDKSILLGTISKGILHLDQEGSIINRIDQTNGLSNNTVLKLFEDIDGNVWAALDNGMNCLNIQSYIKEYSDIDGTLGTVYCSIAHKGNLYLGTNQGLFYKSIESIEPYRLVEGSKGQVWSLAAFDGDLLCGHTSGAFQVHDGKVSKISSVSGTWGFRRIPNKPDLLLLGNYVGLSILAKEAGEWKFKTQIQGFENSARFFEIMEEREVWVNHGYKGVFKLKINEDFTSFDSIKLLTDIPKRRGSGLLKVKDDLLYAYTDGIYKLGPNDSDFTKDTILSKLIPSDQYISGKLLYDQKERLWSFNRNSIRYMGKGNLTGTNLVKDIPIRNYWRKTIVSFENIAHLDKSRYLVGKTNGYLLIDLDKLQDRPHAVILNKISIKLNNTRDSLVSLTENGNFKHRQNSIEFKYNVPRFSKYEHIDFQYKLDGMNDSWSEWDEATSVLYDKLPFGNYAFNLRSKIGDRISDNVASYTFQIEKPFYLSNLAMAGYILLLSLIGFVTHRSYKRYYRRQHEKILLQTQRQLELNRVKNEQELIKLKNEKLNHEIESKNRELAISTMSIVKRNEVLRGIKKELIGGEHDIKSNEAVLALIDKNLNSSKDWNLFKEAFNNADKDFLKRIKKRHPILTHNDLKFCAYLRLNLSSKEIAPLLNISLKSIEIRRYRLRKKMELIPKTNLTDYILDI